MSKKDEEKTAPEAETEEQSAPAADEVETPAKKTEAELLQEKLDEANAKYLRMLAEYDNYRRRSQKERESIYTDVRADTVSRLLPVYDNLLRAAQQEATEEARKGMEAIVTQFETILAALGVGQFLGLFIKLFQSRLNRFIGMEPPAPEPEDDADALYVK